MNCFSVSKRLLTAVCTSAIVLSAALSAHAQTSGVGNIAGTVTDSSGASVPNASVVVLDNDTGVSRTLATDSNGSYTASFLQPGHYEITVTGSGFGKVDRKNIVLTVGQILTIDASLPAASVSTSVVVTSDTPLLDTQKTDVSQTIDQQLISNLPVNGRNWSNFVLSSPNVVPDGGTGLVSFRGISGLYNQNYVDGANNNQMLFSEARGRSSGAPYVYSLDSIKEFQSQISNYSVEFGQAAGGQVNAITKSGTNSIHGDAFYYLRYPTLNALDPLSKFQALHGSTPNPFLLTQPIHQQQQFGASVGGPILKDRLFYFFTYDGFRRVGRVLFNNTNASVISLTPTPAVNNSTSYVTPAQCPSTITAAQCSSAINFILTASGLTTTPPTRFAKQNIFFPRLDFHINSKNDMFVNYNLANFDSTYGYVGAPTISNSSPSANGATSYHERFLIAGLTTQISDRSVNQIHFQYGRDLETAGANSPGPSVNNGVFSYGMPNALPRIAEPDEHRTQFTDVFSTVHGHHSLKFGGDANIVHEVMINLFQGGGVYGYSGTVTQEFQSWAADSFRGQPGDTDPFAGYHYNTFVQTVDQLNTGNRAGADDFWIKMFDGFAEDTWKISHNLTLTAGVRYDIQLTPPPIKNNTNYAPLSTTYSSTIKNVTDRVQPRLGLSWQPYEGTVVRAGYGLFSALNQGSTYYAMRVENGVVQVNYNYTGCNASVGTPTSSCPTVPNANNALSFPNVPFSPTGAPLNGSLFPAGGTGPAIDGPAILGTQSFHGLDPNFVPPLAHEAELSVEQTLPGNMTLSVGYVGSRALRLPIFLDANLIGQTAHGSRSYNVLDSSNKFVSQLTVPVYLVSDRRDARLQSYNTGFSVANSWYNSLAVSVRRPFKNGLQLLGNYTWSRATDTGQVGGANGTFYGGDTPLDPNNPRGDNGLADIDVRHRFIMSFVYQPQLFRDNKWAKIIVDGFTFSGAETASAGQPIFASMSGTVYSGSSTPANGIAGAAGNIYGGAMSSSSGAATTGRPPQIGRGSLISPGFNNVDFRISRDIPIYNRIKLQLTGEAFNLLNRRIITGVNGGYSTYVQASATSATCSTTSSAPAGSPVQGCITPSTSTGTAAFGAPSSTNNTLYGPRQLQVAAKLFF